ncbi:hypothetical protein C8R46DRAFT_1277431 [Mycena filopes]|nr:hypothetical protein C8R46DRAFT_1277431 [Mycena filopes]
MDTNENTLGTKWVATEWIAQGKKYKDLPTYVEAARRRILQLPTSTGSHFPSKTLPISQLLLFSLPPVARNDNWEHTYSTDEPTRNIEESLAFLAVPSRPALQQMVNNFGQAWLDGNKSIRTLLNPEIVYPLWVLTYWGEMLEVAEAKGKWLRAERWLHKTGKTGETQEEAALKLQVRGIWSVVGWHGALAGFGSLPLVDLATLFSDDYLSSCLVDAMLALLSLRARIAGDETLIIGTTFAEFIRLRPPIIDGVPAGPIVASAGGQKYLQKYGSWFQSNGHKRLYNVLYREPNHWTTSVVNFEEKHIRYGDGLKWKRPKTYFTGLQSWIQDYHGQEFHVSDDLVCARQTDGFNCPIIAVNAIAHSEFGDALWTKERARAMRMQAFCDILKHSLSVEEEANTSPAVIDTDDLAENLLAVDADINNELFEMTHAAADSTESSKQSLPVSTRGEEGPDVVHDVGLEAAILESLQARPSVEPTRENGDGTDVVKEPVSTSELDHSQVDVEMEEATPIASQTQASRGTKRRVGKMEDVEDGRKKKLTKPLEQSARPHPFFASDASRSDLAASSTNNKKKTSKAAKPPVDTFIGASISATNARNLRAQVKAGTFVPSAAKTAKFRNACTHKDVDPDAKFEPTSSKVQCSTCKTWVAMKDPYNTSRFREHRSSPCSAPPPPKPLKPKANTLTNFLTVTATRPKPKDRPQKASRPCPGLTAAYDPQIGVYLAERAATGGGAPSPAHYADKLFQKVYAALTDSEKEQVRIAQLHDRAWRNDTSPGIVATFSTKCLKLVEVAVDPPGTLAPCEECQLVYTLRSYKTAIKKPAASPQNLRFVPHVHQNHHAGHLYAKFHGLEGLMSEDNPHSLERRYITHVLNGDFKDDKVFNGIIQAKVLAKTRELNGRGNQNFKHDEDVDALFGLIHSISPRAHAEIAKHIPLRSTRSIKHKISTSPRFPLGIQEETFGFVTMYCEDYGYPRAAPLSLGVDDTKLFSALRPLYDGVKKKWFIVGAIGDPIEVPDVEVLHATLDRLAKSPPTMATKLRLWTVQIPLPRVPPLVLAIMAIESKGLIAHGFRITASGGDGAAVERDCQRRLTAASKAREFRIKHPDPDYPDIIVELWELDGNVWVIFQDAKHGRKTFRNNAASGARGLVLGNFVVYFEQMYTLAMQPNSPMYPRDWRNRDRMDDPAAARLSSADTLEQVAQDPTKNLGLVVYLFVFGDLIDAYQSRTISHHERAKIAIQTRLFLHTWCLYLRKAGYSEARHFISKEAVDIFEILVNGILGLIVVHRDHLGGNSCPLLPWFIATEPNEHAFSGFRDVSEDFTLQEAILIVPKLRAKMQAAVLTVLKSTDFKKQASGYSHTYFTKDDIDFGLLSQYPTDLELSAAYEIAAEENNCLWSLLGIHPMDIANAPNPGRSFITQPAPDPDFKDLYLNEDDEIVEEEERSAAEELQKVVDSLKHVSNISRAGDEELDACVMASVALAMEELAKIDDLPETDPERFAEIQAEIAHAMSTQPTAFVALLQGIAASAHTNSTASDQTLPPISRPLVDVSSSDLAPLVALRREHQTREERMGVRTYKGSGTYKNPKTGVEKPLTDRQILAQKMQGIICKDQERGSSSGLNRTVRWTGTGSSVEASKAGDAANAELAARGRARDAMQRRRTVFGKLKCLSTVAEAGIGANCQLAAGLYGFVMLGSEVVLARVITMYSKNGGKAGAHAWVATPKRYSTYWRIIKGPSSSHRFFRAFALDHSTRTAVIVLSPTSPGDIQIHDTPAGFLADESLRSGCPWVPPLILPILFTASLSLLAISPGSFASSPSSVISAAVKTFISGANPAPFKRVKAVRASLYFRASTCTRSPSCATIVCDRRFFF